MNWRDSLPWLMLALMGLWVVALLVGSFAWWLVAG